MDPAHGGGECPEATEGTIDGRCRGSFGHLKDAALAGGNIVAALMAAVHDLSLGQVTRALYEVGGAVPAVSVRVVTGQGSAALCVGSLRPMPGPGGLRRSRCRAERT